MAERWRHCSTAVLVFWVVCSLTCSRCFVEGYQQIHDWSDDNPTKPWPLPVRTLQQQRRLTVQQLGQDAKDVLRAVYTSQIGISRLLELRESV